MRNFHFFLAWFNKPLQTFDATPPPMDAIVAQKAQTRHGKLAEGNSVISFAAPKALKNRIKVLAKKDRRKPSDWLRIHLERVVSRSEAASKKND